MSEENTPPSNSASNASALSNPQVMTALITGVVTVAVALIGIVPTLVQANQPTPTLTATHTPTHTATFTATIAPPTETAVPETPPTDTPAPTQVEPTQVEPTAITLPTTTPEPTAAPTEVVPTAQTNANPPNVLLIYDGAAFTVLNTSGGTLSLQGVRFRSSSGNFNSVGWANNNRLPDGTCLRLRDAAAGNRQPPRECQNLLSLLLETGKSLFWLGSSSFDVVKRGETLATCATDTDRCAVYIPQD